MNITAADPHLAEAFLSARKSIVKQFALVYLVILAVHQHVIQSVLLILIVQVMKRVRIKNVLIHVLALVD